MRAPASREEMTYEVRVSTGAYRDMAPARCHKYKEPGNQPGFFVFMAEGLGSGSSAGDEAEEPGENDGAEEGYEDAVEETA